MRRGRLATLIAIFAGLSLHHAGAEPIKIGYIPTGAASPIFIAQDRGYFTAEGLTPTLQPIDSAVTIAQAVLGGDLDFGLSALLAAHFNLARNNGLRLVAASLREAPGFQTSGYLASNRAWNAGLKSVVALNHRTVVVGALGGNQHYAVALLADKYRLDMSSMTFVQIQGLPNIATAIAGGQPDFSILPAAFALPLAEKGQAHLLGWVGDETPFQVAAVYMTARTGSERRPIVEAFIRAYRKGAADYHAAFVGPDGKRADGPTAPAILAILGKSLDLPPAQIERAIGSIDPEARLDVKDVLRQIAWLKSQGLVKADSDAEAIVDRRFIRALPE